VSNRLGRGGGVKLCPITPQKISRRTQGCTQRSRPRIKPDLLSSLGPGEAEFHLGLYGPEFPTLLGPGCALWGRSILTPCNTAPASGICLPARDNSTGDGKTTVNLDLRFPAGMLRARSPKVASFRLTESFGKRVRGYEIGSG
jgi:hypothetical protein